MIADGPLASRATTIQARRSCIKRTALRRTRLPEAILSTGRVKVVDAYSRCSTALGGGFSVPLVASGEMFGLLNVEYPAPQRSLRRRRAGADPAGELALGGAAQREPARRGALLPRLPAQDDRRRQRAHHRHRSRGAHRRHEPRDAALPRRRTRGIIGTPLEQVRGRSTARRAAPVVAAVGRARAASSTPTARSPLWREHKQKLGRGHVQHVGYARARRQHRRRHRHRPRHRAHAIARAPGDPGRKASDARAAGGGRRARAQQPAHVDQRLRRLLRQDCSSAPATSATSKRRRRWSKARRASRSSRATS